MATITLEHPNVNSGTSVVLHGAKINYAWKNLFAVDPIPSKNDIVESGYEGFENPKIVIKCSVDVDDLITNSLTQQLLTEFSTLRSTTPVTLTIQTGSSNTPLKGRPTGGYESDGGMTMTNSIEIQIESFSIDFDSESEMSHFWNYNIVSHETI